MYATLVSRDVDCCLIPESPFYLEGPGQELIPSNDTSIKNKPDASSNDLFQDVDLWLSQKSKQMPTTRDKRQPLSQMDAAQPSSSTATENEGGPAPFVQKTYDMVDDSATDDIVSWSSTNNSFVVWNPPEFAYVLLPTYFKHNNFSSFIHQLDTYGFRKIDSERCEFANEEFIKDQKHLLKNIDCRKPIHSHSHPPGSAVDPERAALEEEIEKLSQEKNSLESRLLNATVDVESTKFQLDVLEQLLDSMEKRQTSLSNFFEKALQNPNLLDHVRRNIESMDVVAYNSLIANQSNFILEFENVFHQEFSNKLRLELSPSVSDMNFVSGSTHVSNEDEESLQKHLSEGELTEMQTRTERPGCSENEEAILPSSKSK
ncbi:heat stress transcription factor A-5 isoform X4 [Medicago truncatula]|nr:heat stress transcription factor A-5 isoform X4 [Medicago truncatula]